MMKVFVTGGTGAIGKFLLPLLLDNKHEVVALTRSVIKAAELPRFHARSLCRGCGVIRAT